MNAMPMDLPQALSQLADAAGIEGRYWDIHGQLHETAPDTMRALLRALGIAAETETDIAASLARLSENTWRGSLPPVVIAREGSEIDVPLRVPMDQGGRIRWSVRLETGAVLSGECDPESLSVENAGYCEGRHVAERRLKLPSLPLGYHDIRIEAKEEASTRLILAPQRCMLPPKFDIARCWGVAAQLYALKSAGDWGIGDFGDLRGLIDRLATGHADAVGLNPLHALFLDTPEDASPYSPSSRLFRNPLYLDVTAIPDFAESREARALAESSEISRALKSVRDEAFVDYKTVTRIKLAVLECLYRSFIANHSGFEDARGAAFLAFEQRCGQDLDRFAVFQTLSEHFQTHDWGLWPAFCHDPASAAIGELKRRHAGRVRFFAYLQWQCEEQLKAAAELARARGMGVGLYNDLAVSVNAASADHWSHQDLFAGGARIGSPPDPFNEAGQEWGVVPMNPFRLRTSGFSHFIQLLRANMRHAGALRIDHVMGWQRLFLIPAGEKPAGGAYVRYPFDDLLAIAALESQRNRCLLVGEDLGTVPAGFRERMTAANVLSCRVFYFERDREQFRRPNVYPQLASVSVSTHDLATLRGFWSGADIASKAKLGLFQSPEEETKARAERDADKRRLLQALEEDALLPEGMSPQGAENFPWTAALSQALHAYLARSPGMLFMAQLDDLIGVENQTNLPGTNGEYPNWSRRHPQTLEALFADPALQGETRAIAAARAK